VISVVIPTRGRPELVGRAVSSALGQSWRELEVIVVIDGLDAATRAVLAEVEDGRLHVLERAENGGQAAAINTGVAAARGEWIALLDDDDEWMPEKLAAQMRVAGGREVIVGCRFVARSECGEAIWPRRAPRARETAGEYLFCRTTVAFGEGIQPTTMLLAPAELLRRIPFDQSIPTHGDLDWLVRAGTEMVIAEEPLAVWNMQRGRARMSTRHRWELSLEWARRVRPFLGERAFAGFLLTWVSEMARENGDWGAAWKLFRAALAEGRPRRMDLLVFLAVWCVPPGARRWVSWRMQR
jgi:glycosyltransferase involved in cell wall biosynthesis